jgi:cell division transport system permease protein
VPDVESDARGDQSPVFVPPIAELRRGRPLARLRSSVVELHRGKPPAADHDHEYDHEYELFSRRSWAVAVAMWHKIGHAVTEGLRGLRRHPSLALASVVVLAGVLFIAAVFALATVNLLAVVEDIRSKVDMVVLLDESMAPDAARGLATMIARLEGVAGARYVPTEEVLRELGADASERRVILDLLGEEPFPASLEISLGGPYRTPERLEVLSRDIEAIPGVDEAVYGKEWVEPLARVVRVVLLIDGLVGGVVVLVCAVVAWGSGRLAVYGRQDVVRLMRLTGAGRWYMASPFAVEGGVCGLVGGVVAVGALYGGHTLLSSHIAGIRFLPFHVAVAIPGAGAVLGLLGSVAALKRS